MNRIKELRLRAGMQQKELAICLGIHQPAISDWERQKADPSPENVEKLMKLFNVERDDIIVPPPQDRMTEWNVEYPAGVALRTYPQPQPGLSLSEADITRIAERVAQMNTDAKTSPVLNSNEQQLIEEYRMLSTAGRIRVQRLISVLLDNKFNDQ